MRTPSNNLGTNLIKLGRYDEAERFLGRAKELKPYDANYQKNYDQAYRCAVKKDERLRLEYAIIANFVDWDSIK